MKNTAIKLATTLRTALGIVAALLVSSVAAAHPGHDQTMRFVSGFSHPFLGLDHLLAMVAIGIWAAQRGGKALWVFPCCFVLSMLGGAALGLAHLQLPAVEFGIQFSILALGLLIACMARLPLTAALPLIALFASAHGYAHAVEMPRVALTSVFLTGMLLATCMLHLTGIAIARIAYAMASESLLRWAGVAIVGAGALLIS